MLTSLIASLQALVNSDSERVADLGQRIETAMQAVGDAQLSSNGAKDNIMYKLRRVANARIAPTLEHVTRALLSSAGANDLRRLNPFMSEDPALLLQLVSILTLRVSRVSQARRGISMAAKLREHLYALQVQQSEAPERLTSETSTTVRQLSLEATALAETISARRHFFAAGIYDPRFLVFEYIFDILLRHRQVEIVRSFAGNQEAAVQQMIMGAGKTLVVAPLLALILANGNDLVTIVMPTALLEQSRTILRNRFSAVVPKRIYTLAFERSCDDSASIIDALKEKLEAARRFRGVVVAPPESVKSLMLKFVEQLHSVEQLSPQAVTPSASARQSEQVCCPCCDNRFCSPSQASELHGTFGFCQACIWYTGSSASRPLLGSCRDGRCYCAYFPDVEKWCKSNLFF
jgi:hypothetical protein